MGERKAVEGREEGGCCFLEVSDGSGFTGTCRERWGRWWDKVLDTCGITDGWAMGWEKKCVRF